MVKILREADVEPVDVKRLRHLEQGNVRLKKLVAERGLDLEVMKEVATKKMVSARVRRADAAGINQERQIFLLLTLAFAL